MSTGAKFGANLVAIADEIRARCTTPEEMLDAVNKYDINEQQKTRVRQHLGVKIRDGVTRADLFEREDEDIRRAIERAKKRPPKRATQVTYFGHTYWDVTPLFIDCGD